MAADWVIVVDDDRNDQRLACEMLRRAGIQTSAMRSGAAALDYIRKFTQADGIITTKANLIPYARSLGFYTVLRYFVLDSMALESVEKGSRHGVVQPDVIEILPGILPAKMIREFNRISRVPIICGGLIRDREDVMQALKGGAAAISTTNQKVWFL